MSEDVSDAAGVVTESIAYAAGDTPLVGYLARDPAREGPLPGVLVVHEWWGLDDHVRRRARMLAGLGYVAMAVDMYGEGRTAANPQAAGALMNGVLGDMGSARARLQAACDVLAARPETDAERMAAIGYCFGGAMVLHAARTGLPLVAVASFHGVLSAMHEAPAGSIGARILVCHGGADVLVPEEQLEAFEHEMRTAGADYRLEIYDGAMHGFTNPAADENGRKYGLPLAYDADVDRRAWASLQAFLAESFA